MIFKFSPLFLLNLWERPQQNHQGNSLAPASGQVVPDSVSIDAGWPVSGQSWSCTHLAKALLFLLFWVSQNLTQAIVLHFKPLISVSVPGNHPAFLPAGTVSAPVVVLDQGAQLRCVGELFLSPVNPHKDRFPFSIGTSLPPHHALFLHFQTSTPVILLPLSHPPT